MKQKRYDNGEIVTKNRIEDEEWYSSLYHPFLEFVLGFYPVDVEEMYSESIKFIENLLGRDLTAKEKEMLLRWTVFHAERMGGQKDF